MLRYMTVEFDIPIPPPKAKSDKYGVSDLPVNGSKFIPVPEDKNREYVARAIRLHATRHRKWFVLRYWKQDGVTGIRVWRSK